ncbi:CsgE family curli-type amyloid fiber assembly protein [Rouxiella chamberiensis]|uniref:CsgE family curli-type amyloid fiber assembly protein n=1 Tax=Rouxiella chamberiensis TaxID=1513468 RepID=UPI0039BE07F2
MKSSVIMLLLWGLLSGMGAQAANIKDIRDPGLITDHTVSAVGHDFYRLFTDRWEKIFRKP